MFQNILEQLKTPVTTIIEKSEREDLKKGLIKLAILSGIMSLINVITTIISIFSTYSKKIYRYSSSSSELWDKRWNAIKDAELFGTFFKTFIIIAIAIAVVALILFIIAKLVKSPKEYKSTLSMINNTMIIYVAGSILNIILSFIYKPLGILVLYAVLVYAVLTLLLGFRDSLEINSSDNLALISTGILLGVFVIVIILICAINGISLKDLNTVMNFFG